MKTVIPKGIWRLIMKFSYALHRMSNRVLDIIQHHYDPNKEFNNVLWDGPNLKIIFKNEES